MRYDLDQLRDMTQGVQEGLGASLSAMQAPSKEQEFMMSRQTLRPMADSYGANNAGGTLNERAVHGETHYHREEFGVTAGSNAEIDDLRRE